MLSNLVNEHLHWFDRFIKVL